MLSDRAKELFAQLDLELSPIAVKFSYNRPAGFEECTDQQPLCKYARAAMDADKPFYISLANEKCLGRMSLGYEPFEEKCQSGLVGYERGYFRTSAANAHLYHEITPLKPGQCNFVTFAKVADCEFDPDILIFVAPTKKAAIIQRAGAWVSGDCWESKCSMVLSCAWMYAYPYVTGKINQIITGMASGMSRYKLFPVGMHLISVPFQKIDELVAGLDEMPWEIMNQSEDEYLKALNEKVTEQLNALNDPDFEQDICSNRASKGL